MNPATYAIGHPRDLFPSQLFGVHLVDSAGLQDATDACDDPLRALLPEESALVADAIDKRRRQFAAGRHCAHRALNALHARRLPLLRDTQGAPAWPEGMVGSISHTEGLAIGVVARRAQVAAVGVDVESRREPFPLSVLPQICVDPERARLAALPEAERALFATAYFSIKETIYKCIYAETGERLGFHDARVEFDLVRGVFVARLSRPLPGGVQEIDGRIGYNDDCVFSGAWRLREAATMTAPQQNASRAYASPMPRPMQTVPETSPG